MELAPQWLEWLAENELRGVDFDTLVGVLVAQGLDEETARQTVLDVRSSPLIAGARKVVGRAAGTEQAARLRRTFERLHPLEHAPMDDATFFETAWSAHRPVVLRGATDAWPQWSLEGLRKRFGHVSIEVMRGRKKYEHWWKHREALATRMTVSELLDEMEQGESGNDLYGVGRNDVLDALEGLAEEVGRLPGIDPERRHLRLWIGPEGTLTPLHHDQSAAWLCQRVGRKRVWIASPLEPALLDTAEGVFNLADARAMPEGDAREVFWWEAVIEPGDAVFLPAGWWHQVLAESASVSVSLGGFRWPNSLGWYSPGR